MFESALDAIIAVDHQQKIVLFNHAAEVIFGWTRQDVLQQPFELLIAQRFRRAHSIHLDTFDATDETARRVRDLSPVIFGLCANGEEFPLHISISQVLTSAGKLLSATVRDITAQQTSQERLRLLEASISHLDDMVMITDAVDAPGQRIVFVNAAFERHTGYSSAEVMGPRWPCQIPPPVATPNSPRQDGRIMTLQG